jgi:hypothetical protein
LISYFFIFWNRLNFFDQHSLHSLRGSLQLHTFVELCLQAVTFFKITKFPSGTMIKIEYPPYQPKIKNEAGKEIIFDEVRKKWVLLAPEEWVRQNFLQYLVRIKKYPASLIAVEKEIKLGDLKKRFDIVVYDALSKPWMIIECKEMSVELNSLVLDQVLRYNISMQVPYLVITNGSYCMAFQCINNELKALTALP